MRTPRRHRARITSLSTNVTALEDSLRSHVDRIERVLVEDDSDVERTGGGKPPARAA
jgi:hypothetical protein